MNRIDRLFGLVTLLQARRYVPAEHLATQFGISVRTVYRDVRALGEQGIPVSFEAGQGYFLVPGYFLPPVSFRCIVPGCDGVFSGLEFRTALWDQYSPAAPA